MQVSSSKKWLSKPALDNDGNTIIKKSGKPVLRKSYSVLQDDFFNLMLKPVMTTWSVENAAAPKNIQL